MLTFYRQLFVGLPREVWFLSAVTFMYRSGTMVLPFLTLYLTTQHGYSAREAGGVLSLYGVGSIGGAYLGGVLSDRFGSLRTQWLGFVCTAGCLIVLSGMRSPAAIATVVMVMSIAAGGFHPANAAALAESAPPHLHVRAFGLRRLSMNLGMSIGPAMGGVLVAYSYFWLFFVEASVCVAAAGLVFVLFRADAFSAKQPRLRKSGESLLSSPDATVAGSSGSDGSPYKDGVFLTLVLLVTLLITVLCQLFGAYPLTLTEIYGLPEYAIGLVFTLNTLVIVVFQMPIVHAVERFDSLQVIGVGAFLLCLGFALLPLASSMMTVGLTVLVWTLGEMLTTPLLEGFVATRSQGAHQGAYMGIFSSSFSMAFVLAPLGGTWIYEEFGYRLLWLLCGVMGIVLWIGFSSLSIAVKRRRVTSAPKIATVSPRIAE